MARPPKNKAASSGATTTVLAAFLAWIVPGLGHVYLGHKVRGLVIMITIALTYWGGVAIGGVKTTVQPQERQAWFMAQVCAGAHTGAALILAARIPNAEIGQFSPYTAYYPADDIAVVYTGIAGLLNLLVIIDASSRTPAPVRAGVETGRASPPRSTA
mgnify:CR=1 FL=1